MNRKNSNLRRRALAAEAAVKQYQGREHAPRLTGVGHAMQRGMLEEMQKEDATCSQ